MTNHVQTMIERVSPTAAFRRAAPSTFRQCEGSEQQAVADIGRLVPLLPRYLVRIRREPHRTMERIKELVHTLRPAAEDEF